MALRPRPNENLPMSTSRSAKWAMWFSIIAMSFFVLCHQARRQIRVPTSRSAASRVILRGMLCWRDPMLPASRLPMMLRMARPCAFAQSRWPRCWPGLVRRDSVIETVALDGFAAQLPLDLITNTDPAKAVAWLAVEPADAPWLPLPGKSASAGPFYIVWTGGSGLDDPQRTMAVSGGEARKPAVAGGALARARCSPLTRRYLRRTRSALARRSS